MELMGKKKEHGAHGDYPLTAPEAAEEDPVMDCEFFNQPALSVDRRW